MYGLFPNIALMFPEDMNDLRDVTRSDFRKKAFVFERAILADRSAAFRGPYTGPTSRTVAGATAFGTASRWWWEPVRRQVLRFSGVPDEIIDRNLEGYGAVDPVKWEKGGEEEGQYTPLAPIGKYRPVVTYISRQSSRRRLTPESHADLVKALEERAKKLDFELIIVEAERLTKEEQFAIAGKTTVSASQWRSERKMVMVEMGLRCTLPEGGCTVPSKLGGQLCAAVVACQAIRVPLGLRTTSGTDGPLVVWCQISAS